MPYFATNCSSRSILYLGQGFATIALPWFLLTSKHKILKDYLMKNRLLLIGLASATLFSQPLHCATATSKNATPTASTTQITPITEEHLKAKFILPILKQTGVQFNDATLSLYCNMPVLTTIGKGLGASFITAFLALAATIIPNEAWGYTNSNSIDHRGIKCVFVTTACVLLGAASAYGVYRILKDMTHKLRARFSSTPLLSFSPEGINVWGKQLASWDTIESIEPFEQVESINGVFEAVPTLCIYNTAHQCLMVLPQTLLPLTTKEIVELASAYKALYQTQPPATR